MARVAGFEGSDERSPAGWTLYEDSGGAALVDEPIVFHDEPETERWLEIRDVGGRLITAIELLSPTNKGSG